MAPILQRCAHCNAYSGEVGGKEKGLMQFCGGCHNKAGPTSAYTYCNRKCQKAGWKDHKEICKMLSSELDKYETHALDGMLRITAMEQLGKYGNAFGQQIIPAMKSAMNVDSPSGTDLSSTHIGVISVRWSNNVKLPVEKEFTVIDIEILSDRDYDTNDKGLPRAAILRKKEATVAAGQIMSHTYRPERLEIEYHRGRTAPIPHQRNATMIHYVIWIRIDVIDGSWRNQDMAMSFGAIFPRETDPTLRQPNNLRWKEHLISDLSRPPASPQQMQNDMYSRLADDIYTRPEVMRYFLRLYQGSRIPTAEEIAHDEFVESRTREAMDDEARKRQQSR